MFEVSLYLSKLLSSLLSRLLLIKMHFLISIVCSYMFHYRVFLCVPPLSLCVFTCSTTVSFYVFYYCMFLHILSLHVLTCSITVCFYMFHCCVPSLCSYVFHHCVFLCVPSLCTYMIHNCYFRLPRK